MNRNRKRHHVSEQAQFDDVPTQTICESIMLLVNVLKSRGQYIYDFDDKSKCIQEIKIFDKIYFLATEESDMNEKGL